jgi:hypothetical protein
VEQSTPSSGYDLKDDDWFLQELKDYIYLSSLTDETKFATQARQYLKFNHTSQQVHDSLTQSLNQNLVFNLEKLQRESRYNNIAQVFNTLAAGAVQIIQGNFTVISRAGLAIGRLFGRGSLSSHERRELFLLKRRRQSTLPALDTKLAKRENSLINRLVKSQGQLLRRLINNSLFFHQYEEAQGYVDQLSGDETPERLKQINIQKAKWNRHRSGRLQVATGWSDPPSQLRELYRQLASGNLNALQTRIERIEQSEVFAKTPEYHYLKLLVETLKNNRRDVRLQYNRLKKTGNRLWKSTVTDLEYDSSLYPHTDWDRATTFYQRQHREYIIYGRNTSWDDEFYLGAWGALGGPAGLVGSGFFWGFGIIFRAVGSQFYLPVLPNESSDAAALAAQNPALAAVEKLQLIKAAAQRWAKSGNALRGFYFWEGESKQFTSQAAFIYINSQQDWIDRLKEKAARQLLRQANLEADKKKKQEGYQQIIQRFSETKAASKAQKSLQKLSKSGTTTLESGTNTWIINCEEWPNNQRLHTLISLLPIPNPWLNDNERTEQLRQILIPQGRENIKLITSRKTYYIKVDPTLRHELVLYCIQQEQRTRTQEGYSKYYDTAKLPVGVSGGIGSRGIDFAPRLKTLPLKHRDRYLYESP